jgi:hypothetical protein
MKAQAQEVLKQRTMETKKSKKSTKLFLAWSENQFNECE